MPLPLRDLNVLAGANSVGKTNVLEVFRFLADVIRADVEPALGVRGGFEEVVFRDVEKDQIKIHEEHFGIHKLSSGLSTLPRLFDEKRGNEVSAVAGRLASFNVFDVQVNAAR